MNDLSILTLLDDDPSCEHQLTSYTFSSNHAQRKDILFLASAVHLSTWRRKKCREMEKRDKKQRHQQKHNRQPLFYDAEEENYSHPSSAFSSSKFTNSDDDDDDEKETAEEEEEEEDDEDDDNEIEGKDEAEGYTSTEMPSKFLLYQQSVQSPKGDISYLKKFYLMYVGGRLPLHFQDDFCGSALLSTEWLRSDPRRTAVGLDLNLEALQWCMGNNINKVGADGYFRINLFHGNDLNPLEAKLVKYEPQELMRNVSLENNKDGSYFPSQ